MGAPLGPRQGTGGRRPFGFARRRAPSRAPLRPPHAEEVFRQALEALEPQLAQARRAYLRLRSSFRPAGLTPALASSRARAPLAAKPKSPGRSPFARGAQALSLPGRELSARPKDGVEPGSQATARLSWRYSRPRCVAPEGSPDVSRKRSWRRDAQTVARQNRARPQPCGGKLLEGNRAEIELSQVARWLSNPVGSLGKKAEATRWRHFPNFRRAFAVSSQTSSARGAEKLSTSRQATPAFRSEVIGAPARTA